jgi:hypothetical protein
MKNRIVGACSTDGKHEFVNNELVDLRTDGRIILKWISRKQGTRVRGSNKKSDNVYTS